MKNCLLFASALCILCGCANFQQRDSSGSGMQGQSASERRPWIGDHSHPDDIYFGD